MKSIRDYFYYKMRDFFIYDKLRHDSVPNEVIENVYIGSVGAA
jgi:hypothetical protein